MKIQRILAAALAVTMVFGSAAVMPQRAAGGVPCITASAWSYEQYLENAIKLEDVTLYARGVLRNDVELPAGSLTEYIPPIDKDVTTMQIINGSYWMLEMKDGVIRPMAETFWAKDESSTATVLLYADGEFYAVDITVVCYDIVYANKVMDDYIAANFRDDMTLRERVELASSFSAGCGYYYLYQSVVDAIASGKGGDCWAASNIIVEMCDRMGVKAWVRNANRDPGALSGHRNVIIPEGDHYLIADAGYGSGGYTLVERSTLFSTKKNDDGITVFQYDGCDTEEFDLVIPDTIDGKTVTAIGDKFIMSNQYVTSVKIPSTVTSIGSSAFSNTPLLKEIYIPASVERIAWLCTGSRYYKDTEKTITVDPENPWLCSEDNVVYSKDKTKVFFGAISDISSLPDTVTEIAESAFNSNHLIKEFTVPGSVKTIGKGAFAYCDDLKRVTIEEGVEKICAHAFLDGDIEIAIPDSVTEIDPLAFCYEEGDIIGHITVACSSYSEAAKSVEALRDRLLEQGIDQITILYTDKGESLPTLDPEPDPDVDPDPTPDPDVDPDPTPDPDVDPDPTPDPDVDPDPTPDPDVDPDPTPDPDVDPDPTPDPDQPSIPEYPVGDVDGNGVVDVNDIMLLAAHVKGLSRLSADEQARADVDGKDGLTVSDIVEIAAIVKGLRK